MIKWGGGRHFNKPSGSIFNYYKSIKTPVSQQWFRNLLGQQ